MRHILGTFEKELQDSREQVLTMASVAQRNLEHAMRGLLERNAELCNEAIANDEDVNQMEKSIDQQGMEIMMRFQPVAHDLRQVLSTMKVANNLERVADQAENIARRARKINKQPEIEETKLVEPVYHLAGGMVRDSIRAFAEGDVDLALSMKSRDNELDKAHKQLIKRFTRVIEEGPESVKPLLHLIFVVRCLERIGDHAKNICEDAVFIESAMDIRHAGKQELAEIREARAEEKEST